MFFRESGPVAWTLVGDSAAESRLVGIQHQPVIHSTLVPRVNQYQPTTAEAVPAVQFLKMSTVLRRRLPLKGANEVDTVKGVTHKVNSTVSSQRFCAHNCLDPINIQSR